MKKIIIVLAALLVAVSSNAQSWLQNIDPDKPQKLQDIIDSYQRTDQTDNDNNEIEPEEDKDFQFDRWVWYWKNHTDENGYLVSPLKTFDEQKRYLAQLNLVQKASRTTGTVEANWTFQGPSSSPGHGYGIGRITKVAFHPTDGNTFWAATGGGGAWKTTDAGKSWSAVNDNLPVLSVSDIVFNPANPNTIYLCTGDRDANYTYSVGVLKSTDGGSSWDTTGLKWSASLLKLANALIINPKDTNSLLLAANDGIYQTMNGGKTWNKVQTGNFLEVLYNPADTNIVYATCGIRTTITGVAPAQIYRSANGGKTWAAVTTFSNTRRVSLAIASAYPAMVKAIVSNSADGLMGVYSSWDSGKTFSPIFSGASCSNNFLNNNPTLSSFTCDGQAWYDLCITINPLDTTQLFAGGVNTWYSSDAGITWNVLNQWSNFIPGLNVVHADKHFLGFNPSTPGRLFETNDGGIYYSDNPTVLWNDITNGMGITQFYRIAVSNGSSSVLGGAQDNGCKMLKSKVPSELTGGDGMQVQLDYSDPNIMYTASQYGSINKSTDGGSSFGNISRNIPGHPSGAWITPYVIHPRLSNTLLAGYSQVYITNDGGSTWSSIAPAITAGSNIDRIVIAPSNPSYLYILENNTIYQSTDFNPSAGTATFTRLNIPFAKTVSDFTVDPKDETHLWLAFSGYSTPKVGDYLPSRSTPWNSDAGSLPNIPYQCITIDTANGTMYLGSDIGIFFRDSTMADWALYNKGLPNAQVYDLAINYTTDEIWAGTFGRGIWASAKHTPGISHTGISIVPLVNDIINISPNPNNGQFQANTTNSSFFGQKLNARLVTANGSIAWSNTLTFNNEGKMQVTTNGLAKGVYIFEVSGKPGIARSRVVIY